MFLFGFPAFATGQALATTWRSAIWVVAYCLMLGLADRFIVWSLFESDLSSVGGYLIDSAALVSDRIVRLCGHPGAQDGFAISLAV